MEREMCSQEPESIHRLPKNFCCQATNNDPGSEKSNMLIVVLWKEDLHSVHSDKVQSLKSKQKRYSRQPRNTLRGGKKAKTWKVDEKQSSRWNLWTELINYSICPKTSTLRKLLNMLYRVQHRSTHLCVLFLVTLEAALTSRYQSNRQRAGIGQKRMTQLSSRILLFSLSFSP